MGSISELVKVKVDNVAEKYFEMNSMSNENDVDFES